MYNKLANMSTSTGHGSGPWSCYCGYETGFFRVEGKRDVLIALFLQAYRLL